MIFKRKNKAKLTPLACCNAASNIRNLFRRLEGASADLERGAANDANDGNAAQMQRRAA